MKPLLLRTPFLLLDLDRECQELEETGRVEDRFLTHRAQEIHAIFDMTVLKQLQEFYNPVAQPKTFESVAYCDLMLDIIDYRLRFLENL